MWYDRPRMRMFFLLGAALILVGLGAVTLGHNVPGAVTVCVGVAALMISFSVLRLHARVALNQRGRGR